MSCNPSPLPSPSDRLSVSGARCMFRLSVAPAAASRCRNADGEELAIIEDCDLTQPGRDAGSQPCGHADAVDRSPAATITDGADLEIAVELSLRGSQHRPTALRAFGGRRVGRVNVRT